MKTVVNIIFSCIILSYGLYEIYITYKKPAPLFSTDLKGYFGGFFLIVLSFMSLIGKLNLVDIFKDIFHVIFK
ncbi:hypothetical protein [Flavobacterium sp.]|uniref:hypothetical protein n=1 Tax=Flavobacterium sp. TaxID=239 RepID=UPI0025FE470B|nr:hypothetical protein [Flavobacterium sp.]